MSKINTQSNSLHNIEFVQDISSETAASYSGGAVSIGAAGPTFDSSAIGADIVFHKDPNGQGQALGLSGDVLTANGAAGEFVNIGVLPDGGETTFNDTVSSIIVNRGTWQFFTDDGGGDTGFLAPGSYNLGANDDRITSVKLIRL
ncbi:MAG TPA: hypothetical protein V6C71_15885 [Coleofasciculaceae cyanobacterium]|jgi:hypothetical protein